MVTNLVHLGDKVDIRIVQQMLQTEKTGVSPHVYKSQVHDITEDGELEITMPIENEKLVLLSLGIRYEFVFYTSTGLYHGIGQIKERYKRDNIYVLLIELHSQLRKFQRREYYRYPCLLDTQFYLVSIEDVDTKTTDEIFDGLRDEHFYEKQKQGMILDLSGGGVRFVTDEKLEEDSYILLIIRLCNDIMDKQYFIIGHVLESSPMKNRQGKYETRVQFIFREKKVQEEIIRYIFEEERKGRQKN